MLKVVKDNKNDCITVGSLVQYFNRAPVPWQENFKMIEIQKNNQSFMLVVHTEIAGLFLVNVTERQIEMEFSQLEKALIYLLDNEYNVFYNNNNIEEED